MPLATHGDFTLVLVCLFACLLFDFKQVFWDSWEVSYSAGVGSNLPASKFPCKLHLTLGYRDPSGIVVCLSRNGVSIISQ